MDIVRSVRIQETDFSLHFVNSEDGNEMYQELLFRRQNEQVPMVNQTQSVRNGEEARMFPRSN